MSRSFRDRDADLLFNDLDVLRFRAIERMARRKLLLSRHARGPNDLRAPPGNRLEALEGGRKGQFSTRINDQWRVCFRWQGEDAFDVEITDYH